MESAQDVLSKIDAAQTRGRVLATAQPDGAPWQVLFELLNAYRKMVQDHWPLSADEKEGVRLGWFSARNLEEAFPDLHDLVSDASYSLRRSGEI
jgi:hypothetical protein